MSNYKVKGSTTGLYWVLNKLGKKVACFDDFQQAWYYVDFLKQQESLLEFNKNKKQVISFDVPDVFVRCVDCD